MRILVAIGVIATMLNLAPAAGAASWDPAPKPASALNKPNYTPIPKFQLAACRFTPCNCRNECIRWDQNGRCTGTYRTCDTCSTCDD